MVNAESPKKLSCCRDLHICFVNFLFYRNASDFVCNIVYVFVCKMCEDKFGSC